MEFRQCEGNRGCVFGYSRHPDSISSGTSGLVPSRSGESSGPERLIAYLRHPDRRVRASAVATLTALQGDCPGDIDEPELWECWLKDLENRVGFPEDRTATQASESTETALLRML